MVADGRWMADMVSQETHAHLKVYVTAVVPEQPVHPVMTYDAAGRDVYILRRFESLRDEVVGVAYVLSAV